MKELSINLGNTALRDYFVKKIGLTEKHALMPNIEFVRNDAIYFTPAILPLLADKKNITLHYVFFGYSHNGHLGGYTPFARKLGAFPKNHLF